MKIQLFKKNWDIFHYIKFVIFSSVFHQLVFTLYQNIWVIVLNWHKSVTSILIGPICTIAPTITPVVKRDTSSIITVKSVQAAWQGHAQGSDRFRTAGFVIINLQFVCPCCDKKRCNELTLQVKLNPSLVIKGQSNLCYLKNISAQILHF
jgi:hypothetical protein